eukprot:Lankesteria_metandrocarpae@DN1428_c0_g1_i1.p1
MSEKERLLPSERTEMGLCILIQNLTLMRNEEIRQRKEAEAKLAVIEEQLAALEHHTATNFISVFEHGEASGIQSIISENRLTAADRLGNTLTLLVSATERHTRAADAFFAAKEEYTQTNLSLEVTRQSYAKASTCAEEKSAHAIEEIIKYNKLVTELEEMEGSLSKQRLQVEDLISKLSSTLRKQHPKSNSRKCRESFDTAAKLCDDHRSHSAVELSSAGVQDLEYREKLVTCRSDQM